MPTSTKVVRKPHEYIEVIFDICYLIFVFGAMILFLKQQTATTNLIAMMSGLLFLGDSFHLIPRVALILTKNERRWERPLQLGKLVTSITMSVFYVVLLKVWETLYPTLVLPAWLLYLFYFCLFLRIVFSVYPLKQWQKESEKKYAYLRNIPFLIMGVIVVYAFIVSSSQYQDSFSLMYIAIILSFSFYLPVAFKADEKPILGVLMLPKTMMYIWMIIMAFSLY